MESKKMVVEYKKHKIAQSVLELQVRPLKDIET